MGDWKTAALVILAVLAFAGLSVVCKYWFWTSVFG